MRCKNYLLVFVSYFFSLVAKSVSETSGISCFDPACSTPYFVGEIITDLQDHSLRKGTVVEVYAQLESKDLLRIKVGDNFYEVHSSFVRIIKALHEPRLMVRMKPTLPDPSTSVKLPSVSFTDGLSTAELDQSALPSDHPNPEQPEQHYEPPVNAHAGEIQLPESSVHLRQGPHSLSYKNIADIHTSGNPAPEFTLSVPVEEVRTQPVLESKAPGLASDIRKVVSSGEQRQGQESKITPQSSSDAPTHASGHFSPLLAPSKPSEKEHPSREMKSSEHTTENDSMPLSNGQHQGQKFHIAPLARTDIRSHVSRPSHSDSDSTIAVDEVPPVLPNTKLSKPKVESKTVPPSNEQHQQKEPMAQPDMGLRIRSSERVASTTTSSKVPDKSRSTLESKPSEPKSASKTVSPQAELHHQREFQPVPKTTADMLMDTSGPSSPIEKSKKSPLADEHNANQPVMQATSQGSEDVTTPELPDARGQRSSVDYSSLSSVDTSEPHSKAVEDEQIFLEKQSSSKKVDSIQLGQMPNESISEGNDQSESESSNQEANESPEYDKGRPEHVHKSTEKTPSFSSELRSKRTGELDSHVEVDPAQRPLLDITKESSFFRCLSYASNGTFIVPNTDQFLSTQKKSLVATMVLSFARQYFNMAQFVLSKLPSEILSPLDHLLSFTFHLPLVFFATWVLFVFSILTACLVGKFFSRILSGLAYSSSDIGDPTRRSLAEWLTIEENANLLASTLTDKEEAYGRLLVWSTKVNERYETQNRIHSTSETRICTQLRETKAALAESLEENKELKDTHDALVEQLSNVRAETALTVTQLKEEVVKLNIQLEECTRQCEKSIAEKEKNNEKRINVLCEEKASLLQEVKSYQSQLEISEKKVDDLKEKNCRLTEEFATLERELSSLREAFIELKSAELKSRKQQEEVDSRSVIVKNEGKTSTDGWEVEDEIELNEMIEEFENSQNKKEDSDAESCFKWPDFLELGRLRVALEKAEQQVGVEKAAREQEAELRSQLEETVHVLKEENADLSQRLRVATEDCEASKKKFEILSEYFKEREMVLQRDLGRQALTESVSLEELNFLRDKNRSYEVEVKTLREQLTSARRELAETERINRRHTTELDKRLHDNWLASRALENMVKSLRSENGMLRQKIFSGERATVHQLLSGVILPPPPPPPPPPVVALGSASSSEIRSSSRQSEKNFFLPFSQIPFGAANVPQLVPPLPPPSHGIVPPSLFLPQYRQSETNRQSPIAAPPPPAVWDAFRPSPTPASSNSGSNRSVKKPQ